MIKELARTLENELPTIIKTIAQDYGIQSFIKNPDFLEERVKKWHQFGLLTHTKKVRESFLYKVPTLLNNINLPSLLERISNLSLFEASIPLHDLGKIIAHKSEQTNRRHEVLSKELIYQDFLKNKLMNHGLSLKQIDYIADCILNHAIVGKQIRDELKDKGALNLKNLAKKETKKRCEDLVQQYKPLKTEIGIFYLCDSLGKTDIKINAHTDEEITKQEPEIIKILKQRGLSPDLKYGVMQFPINLKLALTYLKSI